MANQSGPPFSISDTITAIILSMRELGLDIFLSPEFRQEDLDAIMARVDAIVSRQQAGQINLDCGLVATTFRDQCDVVLDLKTRQMNEASEEADALAGYASGERRCANPGVECDCDDDEELKLAQIYVNEIEEETAAAEAFLADEEEILAYDIAAGEAFAERQALDDDIAYHSDDFAYYRGGYRHRDWRYVHGCGCETRFGFTNSGSIVHDTIFCS